ncbi:MAG TPA: hypothetical protein VKN76_18490, partial [Kiloniellaceae bacterium]|nr:hypothetical protein [Kiloniellaceae bacterium]
MPRKILAALALVLLIAPLAYLGGQGGGDGDPSHRGERLAAGGLIAAALAQAASVPLADAGLDRKAGLGDLVVLDGSGSRDPQTGKLLSFAWSFVARPAGSIAALDDPAAVKPSFVPDVPGDYRLQLTVSREGQDS